MRSIPRLLRLAIAASVDDAAMKIMGVSEYSKDSGRLGMCFKPSASDPSFVSTN
jgi:hypothetical protein